METSDHKSLLRRLTSNATARNMIDLLLVITILVLLHTAAPVIRGECNGMVMAYASFLHFFFFIICD